MIFKKILGGAFLFLFFLAGFSFAQTSQYIQTIADFTRAVEANPHSARAYVNRANLYTARGEYELAIKDYTEGMKYGPGNAGEYIIIAALPT